MKAALSLGRYAAQDHAHSGAAVSYAGFGALVGFTAALAYGALFSLYAIIRVSWIILRAPADGAVFTLITNAASLVVASMFFAILCGLPAAALQAGVLSLSAALNRRWNPSRSAGIAARIGLGCAAAALLGLHGLVAAAPPLIERVLWESGYLFWSGLPSLVFLGLNFFLGRPILMDLENSKNKLSV